MKISEFTHGKEAKSINTTNGWGFAGKVGKEYTFKDDVSYFTGVWYGRHRSSTLKQWTYKGHEISGAPKSKEDEVVTASFRHTEGSGTEYNYEGYAIWYNPTSDEIPDMVEQLRKVASRSFGLPLVTIEFSIVKPF